jgi:hypothetical protein
VKFRATLASTLLLLTVSSWGQMTPPKPGAEVKKLDYFVGTWTTEGMVAQGPWGAGGKFSSTETAEWMPGNFFVEGHADIKMPAELGGEGKGISYMGYDTDQNTYTVDDFTDQGRHDVSKGTVASDTWTFNSTANYGGQEIKQRMSMKVVSPTSYTMKFEVSIDGTNWMTFMEGKATKK